MNDEEYIVNLDLPPSERWKFLANHHEEINELIKCYLSDFSGEEFLISIINEVKEQIVSPDYLEEIACIASICNFSVNEVLMANLYYDVLKFYLGCTAFAIKTQDTILHARNLDWHTDNNLLSKHSKIFDFQRNGRTVFKSVGWVGFIGVLSGTKPGEFSLTLNAVSSSDSPEIAKPITFLLREVLDSCNSYQEAKKTLEETTITSDCLLLLSGTNPNEMDVIERTPTRFATRPGNGRYNIVTNDYKKLSNNQVGNNMLQETSDARFDRVEELLDVELPEGDQDCLKILNDENIKMNITVQQMVFDNKSRTIKLVKVSRQ